LLWSDRERQVKLARWTRRRETAQAWRRVCGSCWRVRVAGRTLRLPRSQSWQGHGDQVALAVCASPAGGVDQRSHGGDLRKIIDEQVESAIVKTLERSRRTGTSTARAGRCGAAGPVASPSRPAGQHRGPGTTRRYGWNTDLAARSSAPFSSAGAASYAASISSL
jgi:hypothetical protein